MPVSTCLGNLSTVAEFRPDPALKIPTSVAGSRPASAPMATTSLVATSAVAERTLLSSLASCPCPCSGPTKTTAPPKVSSRGRMPSNAVSSPEAITASVARLGPGDAAAHGRLEVLDPRCLRFARQLHGHRRTRRRGVDEGPHRLAAEQLAEHGGARMAGVGRLTRDRLRPGPPPRGRSRTRSRRRRRERPGRDRRRRARADFERRARARSAAPSRPARPPIMLFGDHSFRCLLTTSPAIRKASTPAGTPQ